MDKDYTILNKKVIDANKLIGKRKYEDAKSILLDYIDEVQDLYDRKDGVNYSFKSISQFYLFINKVKVKKQIFWINLMADEAYRLLAYIAVEEKKYDNALEYLNKSLKYNPINVDSFFEIIEAYKMSGNLDNMKESIDNLYDYLYDASSLARYYRNLGFYYIEKEKYELAFSLYLISIRYEHNNFALNEMLYIRKKLNDSDYIIEDNEAVKMLKENDINIGISSRNLKILNNLAKDPKLNEKNPSFIKNLKENIKKVQIKIN